jgi:geranylgeranyl reductase
MASSSSLSMKYKVAVVGGGPAGACAAEIFAQEKNIDTVMFERKFDNAKPCGGAIPLCMVGEFGLPESVVDRKVCDIILSESFFLLRRLAILPVHLQYLSLLDNVQFDKVLRLRRCDHGAIRPPIVSVIYSFVLPAGGKDSGFEVAVATSDN